MKLKLLTLFLTMVFFAFGATLRAETPAKLGHSKAVASEAKVGTETKDIAGTLLCAALDKYITDKTKQPQVCTDACAASPNLADLGPCVVMIVKNNTKDHPNVQKVYDAVNLACASPACSGLFPNTCKNDTVRKACGAICCNIDPSEVKNCMEKNKDKCANYTAKLESVDPERLKATW